MSESDSPIRGNVGPFSIRASVREKSSEVIEFSLFYYIAIEGKKTTYAAHAK
jgi:hypothetical protein